MDKYKRYYGLAIFICATAVLIFGCYKFVSPKLDELNSFSTQIEKKQNQLSELQTKKRTVEARKKKIQDSNVAVQKKIYSPVESDLEEDSLFFAMYNDVIEMLHANSIKIKAIDYEYNPSNDAFVRSGKDYFVCDVNVEMVSNYTNLGKLVQEIYQYPYYIKINKLDVKPYAKDKKILLSSMSIRLYARTEPDESINAEGI